MVDKQITTEDYRVLVRFGKEAESYHAMPIDFAIERASGETELWVTVE